MICDNCQHLDSAHDADHGCLVPKCECLFGRQGFKPPLELVEGYAKLDANENVRCPADRQRVGEGVIECHQPPGHSGRHEGPMRRPDGTLTAVRYDWEQTGSADRQVGGDHYRQTGIQPWDVIDAYGLDFYSGNVLKYLLRAGRKGDKVEDLKKARHYLDKLIEKESEG